MNREIKFRAWLKESKEMVTVFHWHKGDEVDNIDVLHSFNGSKTIFADEYELMQYIGLKDDHGKEIYEGDIIKSNPAELMYLPNNLIGFIKWDQNDCRFVWLVNNIDHTMSDLLHVIVIGNIYQNPELLK